MLFWPVGTVAPLFRPQGTGRNYTTSEILMPFEAAGLREEMIVLFGTSDSGIPAIGAGGSEGGVVLRSTGAPIPGTRVNGGEADDALAGGPSFDQIFLKHVAGLSRADVVGTAHLPPGGFAEFRSDASGPLSTTATDDDV